MNKFIRYILLCLCIFTIFYFLSGRIYATFDDPAPGGVGRNKADTTLKNILDMLLGGSLNTSSDPNNPDPDPTGAYPTQDPNVPTPTWPPGTTPTPTIPLPTGSGNSLLFSDANYPGDIVANAQKCLVNKDVYLTVQAMTGLPAEIIAGIHAAEIGCASNYSCVSGRQIGTNEPDVHGNCTQADTGIGKPNPLPGGGCGFTNLLDSCVYGANHLIGKINKIPSNFDELVLALSKYNGGGNRNCGKTPYPYCPPRCVGCDDIYPINKYIKYNGDTEHQTMYTVYCADYTPCCPPGDDKCVWPVRQKEGVLPIAAILSKYL